MTRHKLRYLPLAGRMERTASLCLRHIKRPWRRGRPAPDRRALPVSSARWSNLAREGADARCRRPQLDDQDLASPPSGSAPRPRPSPASPSRASKPRIWPRRCGIDAVDARRRLGRHRDLDRHHRLEQHGLSIAACPRSWRCGRPGGTPCRRNRPSDRSRR